MKNRKAKAIVYLREGINKLFQIYPKLFHNKSINLLEVLAKNEIVDYKML